MSKAMRDAGFVPVRGWGAYVDSNPPITAWVRGDVNVTATAGGRWRPTRDHRGGQVAAVRPPLEVWAGPFFDTPEAAMVFGELNDWGRGRSGADARG